MEPNKQISLLFLPRTRIQNKIVIGGKTFHEKKNKQELVSKENKLTSYWLDANLIYEAKVPYEVELVVDKWKLEHI